MSSYNSIDTLTYIMCECNIINCQDLYFKFMQDLDILCYYGMDHLATVNNICAEYIETPSRDNDYAIPDQKMDPRDHDMDIEIEGFPTEIIDIRTSIFSVNILSFLFVVIYYIHRRGVGNSSIYEHLFKSLINRKLEAGIDVNFISYLNINFTMWLNKD